MSDPRKDECVTWMDFDRDDEPMDAGIKMVKPDCMRPVRARGDSRSHAVIGQKLGMLYEVPSDTCLAIESLLRQLEGKLC